MENLIDHARVMHVSDTYNLAGLTPRKYEHALADNEMAWFHIANTSTGSVLRIKYNFIEVDQALDLD